MKLIHFVTLFSKGDFPNSDLCKSLLDNVKIAISNLDYPPGSGQFSINPTRKGNGVKPIKYDFLNELEKTGWILEQRVGVSKKIKPGKIDAIFPISSELESRLFALEWETGNISSSHRALNKIILGILHGKLIGGVLILPTRKLYNYLTDRVGNYEELEPYFPIYEIRSAQISEGVLYIMSVEHDEINNKIPRIPKGTDGWALIDRNNPML